MTDDELRHLLAGELISMEEAARYGGFADRTLQAFAKSGRLPAKKIAKVWLTTREAVDYYKANRLRQPVAPRKPRRRADATT